MYKLIILIIAIGSLVYAGSWGNQPTSDIISNSVKNQYGWAEDTSEDDNKLERRRRGKGQRGRRRVSPPASPLSDEAPRLRDRLSPQPMGDPDLPRDPHGDSARAVDAYL